MSETSDPEIQRIVRRVLQAAMGLPAAPPASSAAPPASSAAPPASLPAPTGPAAAPAEPKVVAIGADHGGFELKELLKPGIKDLGFEVIDTGAHSKEAVDYPDIAHQVANLVSLCKAWRGILIDGAGIGSCIVANKIPGVRAGMAYDYSSAVNGREHNDTNVLTLGAGLIGVNLAKQIVRTWLTTEFGGGRHAPRVSKIVEIEKLYLK